MSSRILQYKDRTGFVRFLLFCFSPFYALYARLQNVPYDAQQSPADNRSLTAEDCSESQIATFTVSPSHTSTPYVTRKVGL